MEEKSDFIKKMELGHKMITEGMETAPIVTVQGLVSEGGAPSGGRSGGEDLWSLSVRCAVWRINGGPLQTQELSINRKNITEKEIASYQKEIRAYSVIRIKARVVPNLPLDFSYAYLESFDGIVTDDTELNNYANELQKPVTFEDPVLGLFTLHRGLDWYESNVMWEGKSITLDINTKKTVIIPATLKTAHALWADQHHWDQRIHDYAVQELLPLKNGEWIDEDGIRLTAEKFKARMSLESITIYIDGSFAFWFDDGDLFFGHSVQISGSISEGPTQADIPG